MIIDFHTHIFPDSLAEHAIHSLTDGVAMHPFHDGTLNGLLASMDSAGIEKSVIASIATKPEHFQPIFDWSQKIASERIVPFCSVHPRDPDARKNISRAAKSGIKGIKMHPYYQGFYLDEEKMFPLYEEIISNDLVFLSHTGFDIAFPRERRCGPVQVRHLKKRFSELKFVASHCGAWDDWDEVRDHLVGKPIFMEISFAPQMLNEKVLLEIIQNHPSGYLLFGTDSPWTDQKETVKKIQSLPVSDDIKDALFCKNALSLLNL